MATDMTPGKLAKILFKLEARPPITEKYRTKPGQKHKVYQTERGHMVHWFELQDSNNGTGPYSRKRPNKSAKAAYNRLQTVPGLLWIAEALGADTELLHRATDAANAVKDHRRKCGAVRGVIPWDYIHDLAGEKWTELYSSKGKK